MDTTVRVARTAELPLLQRIEIASGEPFRAIGMADIADDDPLPLDVLTHLRHLGRVWVGVTTEPVAWVAVDVLDGCAHIEQISVHPDHARQGIGRRLLDHVEAWAREQRLAALTMTTFLDVAWNAPYYRRLGFRDVTAPSPGLVRIVAQEAARGLAPSTRVCLRRAVTSTG